MKPVRYKQSVSLLEADLLIEFGNGAVLAGLNKKITSIPTVSVSSMAGLEAALAALA